jgi:hypothetical protein
MLPVTSCSWSCDACTGFDANSGEHFKIPPPHASIHFGSPSRLSESSWRSSLPLSSAGDYLRSLMNASRAQYMRTIVMMQSALHSFKLIQMLVASECTGRTDHEEHNSLSHPLSVAPLLGVTSHPPNIALSLTARRSLRAPRRQSTSMFVCSKPGHLVQLHFSRRRR